MSSVSISLTCPNPTCPTHQAVIPVSNSGEATALFLSALLDYAPYESMPALLHDWLSTQGESNVVMFNDVSDNPLTFSYLA